MSGRVLKRESVFLYHQDTMTQRLFVKGDRIPKDYPAGDHLFTDEPDWEGNPASSAGGVIQPGVPAADDDGDGQGDGDGDPGDPLIAGNVGDVLDRVGDDVAKATAALSAEQATEAPRKGVVEGLQKVIDNAGD